MLARALNGNLSSTGGASAGFSSGFSSGIRHKNLDLFDDGESLEVSICDDSLEHTEETLSRSFRDLLNSAGSPKSSAPRSSSVWGDTQSWSPKPLKAQRESFGAASTVPPDSFQTASFTSMNLETEDLWRDTEDTRPPPLPAAVAVATGWMQPSSDEELPSLGARFHECGECTPCKFYRGKRGCKDGVNCTLCHYPHEELTYSGVRRAMRKRGIAKRAMLEELETTVTTAPLRQPQPLQPLPLPQLPAAWLQPQLPAFEVAVAFRPPPGLQLA